MNLLQTMLLAITALASSHKVLPFQQQTAGVKNCKAANRHCFVTESHRYHNPHNYECSHGRPEKCAGAVVLTIFPKEGIKIDAYFTTAKSSYMAFGLREPDGVRMGKMLTFVCRQTFGKNETLHGEKGGITHADASVWYNRDGKFSWKGFMPANEDITATVGIYSGIYCSFKVKDNTPVLKSNSTTKFQLTLLTKYTATLAIGSYKNGFMGYHAEHAPWTYDMKGTVAAPGKTFATHGTLMTITYMVFMPISLILARFFRETWTGLRQRPIFFKRRVWFPAHIFLSFSALTSAFCALIFIFVKTNSIFPTNPAKLVKGHGLLGLISVGLLICQCSLPWILHPDATSFSLRQITRVIHYIIGTSCFITGVLNMYLAPIWLEHSIHEVPCSPFYVTSLWIGSYISIYLLLSMFALLSDGSTYRIQRTTAQGPKAKWRALITYPFKVFYLGDAPGRKVREILLMVVIGICTFSGLINITLLYADHKGCDFG